MEGRASRPSLPGAATPVLATVRDFSVPRQSARSGRRLVAGYEIVQELGKGGMGVVYLARQVQLDRLVALKMIRSARADREELLRFRTEAESVARLTHPNIVQIYEIGEHDGEPFFSLEYCAGGSLDRRLSGQPVAPSVAASLVEQLARAIEYAHQRGVVHRDLKPANVLLGKDEGGRAKDEQEPPFILRPSSFILPKITDFGLAKRIDAPGQTRAGAIMGTPAYMAPEQASGRNEYVGPACDVYALGAILYECLTGRPPFVGGDLFRTLDQVCHDDPVPPRSLVGGLPRDLETIALKCLRKEPPRRYASAADLADDLRRFLSGEPIAARPVGRAERVVKWARRRPYQAALVAVLALFVASALVAGVLHVHDMRRVASAAQREAIDVKTQADYRQRLGDGKRALDSNLGAARDHFAIVADAADADAALRDEARGMLGEVDRRLRRAAEESAARDKAAVFWKGRDEAFFWLHREAVAGPDARGPANAARAARAALASFPDLDRLPPQDRRKLIVARQEVRFLLAESAARGEPHYAEALRLLDEAAALAQKDGVRLHSAHARRARYLRELGRDDEAAREQTLADRTPLSGALDHFQLGQELWMKGETRAALKCFEDALREQPGLFWAQYFQALALQKLHRDGEALLVLKQCLDARPDFVWLYLLRGFVHARAEQFPRALADFAEAERLSDDPGVRYALLSNRAFVALGMRDADAALRHLYAATRLMPDRYHAYTLMANAHAMRRDRRRAIEAFSRAVELAPARPDLHRTRAGLHRAAGDHAAALRDADEAIRLQGAAAPAADHRDRALSLFALGRYPEALASARHAPKDADAARVVAESLLELNRPKEALAAFDVAMKLGKPDVNVYLRRAKARATMGDLAGVVDEHSAALALKPADQRDKPDAPLLAARGWAYLVTSAPAPALRDFQAALALDPTSADALIGRASVRLDLNQPRDAQADVNAALKHKPRAPLTLYRAARVVARLAALQSDAGPKRDANTRAVALLRDAVEAMPAAQRGRFWREQVRRDAAFRPLSRLEDFARLTRRYERDDEA